MNPEKGVEIDRNQADEDREIYGIPKRELKCVPLNAGYPADTGRIPKRELKLAWALTRQNWRLPWIPKRELKCS